MEESEYRGFDPYRDAVTETVRKCGKIKERKAGVVGTKRGAKKAWRIVRREFNKARRRSSGSAKWNKRSMWVERSHVVNAVLDAGGYDGLRFGIGNAHASHGGLPSAEDALKVAGRVNNMRITGSLYRNIRSPRTYFVWEWLKKNVTAASTVVMAFATVVMTAATAVIAVATIIQILRAT